MSAPGRLEQSVAPLLAGDADDPAQIVSIEVTPNPACPVAEDDDDTPVALIAGVAAAGVAALIVAALICCCCMRGRRRRRDEKTAGDAAWQRDDADVRSEAEAPVAARQSPGQRVSTSGGEAAAVTVAAGGADLRERPATRATSYANGGGGGRSGAGERESYNGGTAYGPGVAVAREGDPNGKRRYEARQSRASASSTPDPQVRARHGAHVPPQLCWLHAHARGAHGAALSMRGSQVVSSTAKTGNSSVAKSRKEQPRSKSRESLQAAALAAAAAAAANAPREASDEDDGPDRIGGPTMMDGAAGRCKTSAGLRRKIFWGCAQLTPVARAEEEPVDVQQQAMLQEVHLQQIAGITDMIQGVKDNLMQQQTLRHNIKQESSLEIFEKIGGGGFGEVFKGSFKGVRLRLQASARPLAPPHAQCAVRADVCRGVASKVGPEVHVRVSAARGGGEDHEDQARREAGVADGAAVHGGGHRGHLHPRQHCADALLRPAARARQGGRLHLLVQGQRRAHGAQGDGGACGRRQGGRRGRQGVASAHGHGDLRPRCDPPRRCGSRCGSSCFVKIVRARLSGLWARAGSVRDWVSHVAGQKYGALYSSLPTKAGTKGCGRTLCALLTSLDVANGMKLLHKYKILHSDLKPHNVLLVSSHTVRPPHARALLRASALRTARTRGVHTAAAAQCKGCQSLEHF